MDFDFLRHRLSIATSRGDVREIALAPRSVADFYAEVRSALADLGIAVRIWRLPVEMSAPVRFDLDGGHPSYEHHAFL